MNLIDKSLNERFEDEWLGRELRDLDVPDNLHESLLAVVESKETQPSPSPDSLQFSRLTVYITVACYAFLLIGVYLFWPVDKDSSRNAVLSQVKSFGSGKSIVQYQVQNPVPNRQSINVGLETIESRLQEIRIKQLEEKLARTLRNNRRMKVEDNLSIVLALSDRSALDLGLSPELVEQDLKNVVEEFPESMGAKLAVSFINHSMNRGE